MSTIIELIKVLRERTGAGMMDCKKALETSNLDVEKAIDWLREKGIMKAAGKSSRIAAEGLSAIFPHVAKKEVLILELNCETDFVVLSDAFKSLTAKLGAQLLKSHPATIEQAKLDVAPLLTEATMKIGEKLDLRRFEFISYKANQFVGQYVHMEGKISTIVLIQGGSQLLADNLAMHITANNPLFISEKTISNSAKEHEAKIQKELMAQDPKMAGKPTAFLEKILEGKIAKIFREQTLDEQAYLLDENGGTVKATLEKEKVTVMKFVRFMVGEGIEKRVDNFAQEVMAQVK